MKVLVAVKRVIDPYVNIHIKPDGSGVETNNVKMAVNPFDEIAVEEAVRLKEQGIVEEIVVLSIGSQAASETLRSCLALGADRAILIATENRIEPLNIAKLIKEVTLQESPNFIMLGKQAIDNDCNQTGQMLAAFLDWPQATFASKVMFDEAKTAVKVIREVDGGLETLALTLPCVITTDLRLNEPRYLSLPNIMKAKKKPIEIKQLTDYPVDVTPRTQILKVTPPKAREPGVMVESVEELVDCLKNKAKVI